VARLIPLSRLRFRPALGAAFCGYALLGSALAYNFCRIHPSLRVTPAMESNLMDHVWKIAELLV